MKEEAKGNILNFIFLYVIYVLMTDINIFGQSFFLSSDLYIQRPTFTYVYLNVPQELKM